MKGPGSGAFYLKMLDKLDILSYDKGEEGNVHFFNKIKGERNMKKLMAVLMSTALFCSFALFTACSDKRGNGGGKLDGDFST